MASKKKPNRPRPASGPRSVPKPAAASNGSPGARPAATRTPAATRPASTTPGRAKGPTRAERLAAAEKARRAKATRTRALVAGVMVALVALITVTVISSRRSNDRAVAKLEAGGSCRYDTKADTDGGSGNNHVNGDVTYRTNPPAGGNHSPTPAGAGVFTATNTPPDNQLVHSLEHGYVVIWHRPDISPGALDDLKALAGRSAKDVLIVPRASLPQPVAATAWHRRLLCSQPDLQALELFVTTYRNKGPEKVPH